MKAIRNFYIFLTLICLLSCANQPIQPTPTTTINTNTTNNNTTPDIDKALELAAEQAFKDVNKNHRIAIVQMTAPNASVNDFLLGELQHILVNKGFIVVERRELDQIREEQNIGMSGEVDDNTAVSIGRFVGADVVVTGTIDGIDSLRRLRLKVLITKTAVIIGTASERFTTTIDMRPTPVRQPTTPTQPATTTQPVTPPPPHVQPPPTPPSPPIDGIYVPGDTLSDMLAWLERSADSHNTYIITLTQNETISPYTLEFRDAINITVVLRGDNNNRSVRLRSNGKMFFVRSNATLILDNNITLHGHNGNTEPLVVVDGGTLRMRNGATITSNTNPQNFLFGGGGVFVQNGVFDMTGGTISNNTALTGGGVSVNSTFNMSGGIITGNTAEGSGGGVYVTISGTFNMNGGNITNNTAYEEGGGVAVGASFFRKSGGIITGYNTDSVNGNAVKDRGGNPIARKGHAVFVSGFNGKRKETTSGAGSNLSFDRGNATGAWDN